MNTRRDQPDLLSDLSDLDLVRYLLADLHDGLDGKVSRLHLLADLSGTMGQRGTMIFGGPAAYLAWVEARDCFVHGNFVATILLCQGLVEQLLAAYLHAGLLVGDIPERFQFRETLRRCREHDVISDDDVKDLERLMGLRNPLSHFRHVDDASNLERRSIDGGEHPDELIRRDANFAISLAARVLAKPAFRLG
jgi:hypothetical protein